MRWKKSVLQGTYIFFTAETRRNKKYLPRINTDERGSVLIQLGEIDARVVIDLNGVVPCVILEDTFKFLHHGRMSGIAAQWAIRRREQASGKAGKVKLLLVFE